MILNDGTIRDFIDGGIINIEPSIDEEQIQPASLDVRLGDKLIVEHTGEERQSDDVHVLDPNTMYIGHTTERVSLPTHLAAQLTGRSSIGRKGVIIHKTAGWIDPGFSGQITLEIYNFSDEQVELDVGSRVGQLIFFEMCANANEPYDGQYQGQEGPTR